MEENTDYQTERFEEILKQNPQSKAFAPLSERYRKKGELQKALQIASEGVLLHPNYHSGKVALAQVLIDLKKFNKAIDLLFEVIKEDRQNILALKLTAKCYLYLDDTNKALEQYQKALDINSEDGLALKMVEKLNSTPSDSPAPASLNIEEEEESSPKLGNLDQEISLVDALIEQSRFSSAQEKLEKILGSNPNTPEALKRLDYIKNLTKTQSFVKRQDVFATPEKNKQKIMILQKALKKINEEIQKHDTNV